MDEAQTYTLTVDGTIGAGKGLTGASGFQLYPYEEKDLGVLTYGATITVELEPHQTIIQQYGVDDNEAPTILYARSEGQDKIIVKFSERVYLDSAAIDGIQSTASLQADYRTVVLQAEEGLEGEKQVNVRVRDMNGNVYESTAAIICCGEDNAIADGNELTGSGPFTISTSVKTEASDIDLVTVGNDVKLSIDESGYVQFTVKDVTLTAQKNVTTVTQKAYGAFGTEAYVPTQTETVTLGTVNDGEAHAITVVREPNGMLKIYLDGELYASCYDEEKRNQELAGGTIIVAETAFAGEPSEVVILNKALGYDEVAISDVEQDMSQQ